MLGGGCPLAPPLKKMKNERPSFLGLSNLSRGNVGRWILSTTAAERPRALDLSKGKQNQSQAFPFFHCTSSSSTNKPKLGKNSQKIEGPNEIFHLCICEFKFVDVKAWPFCSNLQRKHVRTSVVQIRIWPYLIFIVSRTHFLMWKIKDI